MTDTAIQVEGLWKKFRKGELYDSLRELFPALVRRAVRGSFTGELGAQEFWALRDLNFRIPRGQSLGIIGPNGAGKSTLLKVLSRILEPNRGSYQVHGRLSSLIEVGAGFHGDLTGRENIYLNGAILGMKRREIRTKEDAIIDFAGVSEFIDTPVKRYSSGMKARLGFAVAAHMDPEILLVDEVLSVGDALFRDKCVRHMRQLLSSGITVIFISHILDQVRSLCPRTLVLDKGQMVYHGETDGAIRKYLDILGGMSDSTAAAHGAPAYLRGIRLLDAQRQLVTQVTARTPTLLDFELVLQRPLQRTVVLLNVATVGGIYLGTITSERDGAELPLQPGTYPMTLTLDELPLGDGEYTLELAVVEAGGAKLWSSHPLALSVRGSGVDGCPLRLHGNWRVHARPA